jgi:nucleoside-diphosphate-sugar epimerase
MENQILVTGGTGFVGSSLALRLLGCGYRVRVLARSRHSTTSYSLKTIAELESAGVEIVKGDIFDYESLETALQGVEGVFNLVGRLYIAGIPKKEYFRLHVDGTRNLLKACKAANPLKFIVHCSSTGVLGPTGPYPLSELAPFNPSNIYEETKAAGEKLALQLGEEWGLPVSIARPALAYGPRGLHLLAWFQAIQRRYYRVVGAGANYMHPIYIDDVANGLLMCAKSLNSVGKVYHLVGESPVTIRELAGEIASALSVSIPRTSMPESIAYWIASLLELAPGIPPGRLPLTRSRVRFMTESRAYSGERARQELGFIPRVALKEGLAMTVEWYRKEGLL